MVSVVEELKAKLVELDARMQAARAEIALVEEQMAAFETVIKVFEGQIAGHENLDTKDRLMAAGAAVGCQRAIRIDLIIMGSPYQAGGRESIDRSGKG